MATKQKSRSYAHEKEVEAMGVALGWATSQRAWGSDGRALGLSEKVDVKWSGHRTRPDLTIQSKVKQAYPKWLQGLMEAASKDRPQTLVELELVLLSDRSLTYWLDGFKEATQHTIREAGYPKWLAGEYRDSLVGSSAADLLIFREMRRGLPVKQFALTTYERYHLGPHDGTRSPLQANWSTLQAPSPEDRVCGHCGQAIPQDPA